VQDELPGCARTRGAIAPAAHKREQRVAQRRRHFVGGRVRPALHRWSPAAEGRRLPQAIIGLAGSERGVAQVRERGGQQQRDGLAPARWRPPLCRRQVAP